MALKKCKKFTFYHWFISFCPLNPGFIWCRQTSVRTQSGVSGSGKLSGTVVLFIRPCRAGNGAPRPPLRGVRSQRRMALLFNPPAATSAACSPQPDFPGAEVTTSRFSRPGGDVPATKLFAAGVKNFCVRPRTAAP